jgi:peptidoglycan/LPS O-acetylase OafA/YrhL
VLVSAALVFFFVCGWGIFPAAASPWLLGLSFTSINVASALLIVIAMKGGDVGIRRLLKIRFFSLLGLLSYGVYLFHIHTHTLLFAAVAKAGWSARTEPLVAGLAMILPYLPAYLAYRYVDLNAQKLRQRWFET